MANDVVATERLLLRRFTTGDVEALYQLGTLPELIRYTGNRPFASLDEARDFLVAQPLRDYQTYGYGRFACVWKPSGEVIGFSGVKYLAEIGENEFGYRLLPSYWGQGLATEAGRAIIEYARSVLKLRRLVSAIHPENAASKNVVRKLGFRYETDVKLSFMGDTPLEMHSIGI